jgi:hypothetical protein
MSEVVEAVGRVGSTLSPVASFLGPVGTVLGAVGGAQGLLAKKPKAPGPVAPAQAAPFNPTRPGAINRPDTLGEYAGFTPEQERSALATRGVNQGLGRDEDAYYRNLIQRSLIGDNNQPAADTNSLLPVESQYFSRQGINTSGIMDFLKALQGGS